MLKTISDKMQNLHESKNKTDIALFIALYPIASYVLGLLAIFIKFGQWWLSDFINQTTFDSEYQKLIQKFWFSGLSYIVSLSLLSLFSSFVAFLQYFFFFYLFLLVIAIVNKIVSSCLWI